MSKTKFNMLHKMNQIWKIKDCILSLIHWGEINRGKAIYLKVKEGLLKNRKEMREEEQKRFLGRMGTIKAHYMNV